MYLPKLIYKLHILAIYAQFVDIASKTLPVKGYGTGTDVPLWSKLIIQVKSQGTSYDTNTAVSVFSNIFYTKKNWLSTFLSILGLNIPDTVT